MWTSDQNNGDKYNNLKGNDKKLETLKFTTNFKCIEKSCKNYNKIWSGKNAAKLWDKHYQQHHPTQEFLNIINKKLCNESHCMMILEKGIDKCEVHKREDLLYDNNQMELIMIKRMNWRKKNKIII